VKKVEKNKAPSGRAPNGALPISARRQIGFLAFAPK
jgi:hypothetical protein